MYMYANVQRLPGDIYVCEFNSFLHIWSNKMHNTINHKPISERFRSFFSIMITVIWRCVFFKKNGFKTPCYEVKLGLTGKYTVYSNSGRLTRAVHSLLKGFGSWTVNKSGCAATPSGRHALLQRTVVFTVAR